MFQVTTRLRMRLAAHVLRRAVSNHVFATTPGPTAELPARTFVCTSPVASTIPVSSALGSDITFFNSLTNRVDVLSKATTVVATAATKAGAADVASALIASSSDDASRPLHWYICGPTVYDASHLGHARTYVCFDLIHRMLSDILQVPVLLAVGVTDIDDKIAERSTKAGVPWRLLARHFEAQFKQDMLSLNVRQPAVYLRVSEHIDDIVAFVSAICARGLAYEAVDGVYFDVAAFRARGHAYGKLRLSPDAIARQFTAFASARRTAIAAGAGNEPAAQAALDAALEVELGAELGLCDVDVDTGSVRASPSAPAATTTAASTVAPAAASDFSASTDASATSAPSFVSASASARPFKRSEADFALWKRAPARADADAEAPDDAAAWPSPWGRGRPGWHIECSAMTGAFFGPRLDLHGGGEDLRFPHHCNEIAQGEARFGLATADIGCEGEGVRSHGPGTCAGVGVGTEWCPQWVHTGHLHIEGRKMSKSLKNFITVRELLARGTTADEFRMLCLQAHYRAGVDYSADRLRGARAAIATVRDFWELVERAVAAAPAALPNGAAARAAATAYVRALTRAPGTAGTDDSSTTSAWDAPVRPRAADADLLAAIHAARTGVLAAVRTDFDGPRVLLALQELAAVARRYAAGPSPLPGLLQLAAAETARVYRALGFRFAGAPDEAAPSPRLAVAPGDVSTWSAEATEADVAAAHPQASSAAVREALVPKLIGLKPAAAAATLAAADAAAAGGVMANLRWPAPTLAPAEAVAEALAAFRGNVRVAALNARGDKMTSKAISAASALMPSSDAANVINSGSAGPEATVAVPADMLRALVSAAGTGAALAGRVLSLCDEQRDLTLPALGFSLKDIAPAGAGASAKTDVTAGHFLRALHEGEAGDMQRALLEAAQGRVDRARGNKTKQ